MVSANMQMIYIHNLIRNYIYNYIYIFNDKQREVLYIEMCFHVNSSQHVCFPKQLTDAQGKIEGLRHCSCFQWFGTRCWLIFSCSPGTDRIVGDVSSFQFSISQGNCDHLKVSCLRRILEMDFFPALQTISNGGLECIIILSHVSQCFLTLEHLQS